MKSEQIARLEEPRSARSGQSCRSALACSVELAHADDVTSFTYPRQLHGRGGFARVRIAHEPTPYHGRIDRMGHLPAVTTKYRGPADQVVDDYSGLRVTSREQYIEVQLWSDSPVEKDLLDR